MIALLVVAAARLFQVEQVIEVPPGTEAVFVPIPHDDEWQQVTALSAPGARVEGDGRGNQAARFDAPGARLRVAYTIERRERSADLSRATGRETGAAREWLRDESLVRVTPRVRKIAAEVTSGARSPLEKARRVYDYVLRTMRYQKTGDGWGNGSIEWACDEHYGNCTDFHSLFIGLLRASGVPARFEIGRSVPAQGGEIAGYHCWADFWVDGAGWVPVDASEAWKHPERRDYFFGHHDADRFALTRGRDLTFPGIPGSLNYFVDPVGVAGGSRVKLKQTTTVKAAERVGRSEVSGSP